MNLVDLKYCGFLSVRLERFKVKQNSPYKANFRCPLCGDSQKTKSKTRGWLIEKDNTALYHCFNCGASHPLWRLLKLTDVGMYNDYVVDSKLDKVSYQQYVSKPDVKPIDTIVNPVPAFRKTGSHLLRIKKFSSLPVDHPARAYVMNRQIPVNQHYRLYYTPKFNAWVNSIIPDKLPSTMKDKPRLIIPFLDESGHMFGFQGRAFDKTSIRYITIMLDEDKPKVFGLDKVNFTKRYYIVEGPLDSLFLSNCVAMAGADGNARGLESLGNAVFVFDNEPRNKEIVKRMDNALDRGYNVCIWPSSILEKDIDDMVLGRMTAAQVETIINDHTYKGLQGKLELASWRRS